MAFSLQPPPVEADVAELYQWCFRLWEWLQVPERPCFLVHPASEQTNIAVGSNVAVAWGTERYDIDGNFASNVFSAPITGKYLLSASVTLANIDSASDYYYLQIITSNKAYIVDFLDPGQFAGDIDYFTLAGAVIADMDASDASLIYVVQATGTQQTDISTHSYFSGVLVAR